MQLNYRVESIYFICIHFSYDTRERPFHFSPVKCAQSHAALSHHVFPILNPSISA